MTISAQGLALADRHRVSQGRLAATTIAQMVAIWPLLITGGRVQQQTTPWLQVALALMAARRQESAALAAQFARAFRVLETGALEDLAPRPAVDLNVDAATTSLMVLGPQAYRAKVAKQLDKDIRDLTDYDLITTRLPQGEQVKMAANVARAASRHVSNGARETLDDVIRNDSGVIGYVRTTAINPCWFCAMLASRGPVYDEDSFDESDPRFQGPGDQKVHDGCGCMLLPMYRQPQSDADRNIVARVRDYEALWQANPNPLAFRRAYEGRAS